VQVVDGSARILVVGGGIGGLTFAVAAARHGLDAQVVERSDRVDRGAAGIGLHLNAQNALRRVGLLDAVRAVAVDLDAYYVVLPDGGQFVMQPYTAVWGAPTWSVHRADLGTALRTGLPHDKVALGRAVTEIRMAGVGVVATFSDGASSEYDLVVGADGVRSAVRASVLGEGFVRYGGACFWRTTLPRRIVDRATFARVGETGFGLIPLWGDRTHLFVQVRAEEPFDDPDDGRIDRLRARFAGGSPLVAKALALLDDDASVHFGQLEWVEPPAWGVGRVVLIGDAAHAVAPPLALGGAMAIEDAVVLADELAVAGPIHTAIERFRQRRDPRVRFVQERTQITWARNAGERVEGEPDDLVAFYRRNYEPLIQDA
jgi:2-polyprenyl-6-methoxyphenol hydroxylase-like FAD-dependent oxidoreductase